MNLPSAITHRSISVLALLVCVLLIVWLIGSVAFDLLAHPSAARDQVDTTALRGYRGTWYQAYFTKPAYSEEAADRMQGMDEAFVADIMRAHRSITLASFDLDLDTIGHTLIAAHRRSVNVQVSMTAKI